MDWYYAEAGQQRGPVTEVEFEGLVQSGAIREDTLVWRDGMANWQPYRDAKGGASAAAAPAEAGGVVCGQCGQSFAQDEVIRLGDAWVCAQCKPVFLQRLREGASSRWLRPGSVSLEELLARDYDCQIGAYLHRAWEIFKANAGILIGATVLVYVALIAANLVPYLSILLSILLTGPLVGGLWLFYIKKARGEDAGVGDAFGGFGPRFTQLLLASIVSTVLTYLCVLPAAFIFGFGIAMAQGSRGGQGLDSIAPGILIFGGVVVLIGFLGMIYLSVSWIFAFPLVADKRLGFWTAMQVSRKVVAKHWWTTLWLGIVCSVLAGIGAIFCLVGALVTGPVAFMMFALHYQNVFGDLAAAPEIR